MRHVIIGNSAAAVGAVEGIRSVDANGQITLIAAEPYHTFSRPLISYLMRGDTDEVRMRYRGSDFYEKNGVTAILGTAVTHIHPDNREVETDNGSRIGYDTLLAATGSSPVIPPIPGIDTVAVRHTFMTIDDARALMADVNESTRVLIMGAGLIGLKCAEGLEHRAREITVADMAEQILPSILPPDAAQRVQRHCEEHGVCFVLGDAVASFDGGTAALGSGRLLSFDVLVIAVGVRPNTGLVAEAGGLVERGIVTDADGRTTLPDVWAAGDCALSYDITLGQRKMIALLPNAYMQGYAAGRDMAGAPEPFTRSMPLNSLGLYGMHIMTAGSCSGDVWEAVDGNSFKRLYYTDTLNGFVLTGDVARAGIYTSLIREHTPLSSIDFELICKSPQLMAFARDDRIRMMNGEAAR